MYEMVQSFLRLYISNNNDNNNNILMQLSKNV